MCFLFCLFLVFLLIAVQSKVEKRQSACIDRQDRRVAISTLPREVSRTSLDKDDQSDTSSYQRAHSSTGTEGSCCSVFNEEITQEDLVAPFDLAPYFPGGFTAEEEERLQSTVEDLKDNEALKSLLCDSLHIHPNELPQTLESILRSAVSGETFRSIFHSNYSQGSVIKRPDLKDEKSNGELTEERESSEEEVYLPMGVTNPAKTEVQKMAESSKPPTKLQQAQKTAELLQTAINNSEVQRAQEYAKYLAEEPVSVTIDVKMKEDTPTDDRNKEFK